MKIFGAYLLFFASAICAAAAGVAPFGASPSVSRREAEAVRAAAVQEGDKLRNTML